MESAAFVQKDVQQFDSCRGPGSFEPLACTDREGFPGRSRPHLDINLGLADWRIGELVDWRIDAHFADDVLSWTARGPVRRVG